MFEYENYSIEYQFGKYVYTAKPGYYFVIPMEEHSEEKIGKPTKIITDFGRTLDECELIEKFNVKEDMEV